MEALIHIEDKQTNRILDYIPVDSYWSEIRKRQLKNNRDTFDFETFADKSFSEFIKDQNRIVIPDKQFGYAEFVIDEFETIKNDSSKIAVYTTASYLLLKKSEPINPFSSTTDTATKHVTDALANNDEWQVGKIAHTTLRSFDVGEHTNTYDLLKLIASTFGLELQFRIFIENGEVVRFVDMVERVGGWRGFEIAYRHNLLGIKRKSKSSHIVTALLGIGPADVDGNRKTVLVTNEDARRRWGYVGKDGKKQHYYAVYYPESTDQNMTLDRLRKLTENELEKRIKAKFEYEVDFEILDQEVYFGDTVRIRDEEFNPPLYLEARVHTLEEGLKKSSRPKAMLGDYVEFTQAEATALFKLLQPQIAAKIEQAQLMDYTYNKLTIDDKDTAVFEEGKTFAQLQADNALKAAKNDATQKANAAQQAAEEYALAKAQLAETQAEAYADGIVSAEEQARIDADTAKLAEAKQHADQAAADAEAAAEAYTRSQLTNYVGTTQYDNDLSAIQAQIDNQITSHFKDYEPTLSNEPASLWTTNAEKDKHIGDLFYDSTSGYSYRFMKEDTVYKWVLVRDEGIAKALQDAAQAQDTADSKRRVFIAQPTTPYDKGDLWDNNGAIYRSTVTKTASATFSNADWYLIGDVTGENTAADTEKVSGRPAGDIEDKQGAQNKANAAESAAKTHADTVAGQAETAAKSYADSQADNALASAKLYAVAKTVYDTKMQEIAGDLSDKADLTYVDGELVSKANKADVYTISEVDNRLLNYVGVTEYTTDIDGIVTDLNSHNTRIGQNETAIGLKADKTVVDTLEGTVSDNTATLNVQANQIASKVDATYVSGAIDDIEVGGRNLITNSGKERVINNSTSDEVTSKVSDVILEPDKQYTLSFYYLATANVSNVQAFFVNSGSGEHRNKTLPATNGDYKYGIYTFTTGSSQDQSGYIRFDNNGSTDGTIATLKVKEVKLEKGNKATDWTPAPEDVQTEIESNYTLIQQNATNIQSKAESTVVDGINTRLVTAEQNIDGLEGAITTKVETTTFNALEGRVDSAESTLSQHANEIDLRVKENGVIAAINVSPETIQIDAANINLVGAVTVLSDITGDLGTVTAGTINGVNINGSTFYSGTPDDHIRISGSVLQNVSSDGSFELKNSQMIGRWQIGTFDQAVNLNPNYLSVSYDDSSNSRTRDTTISAGIIEGITIENGVEVDRWKIWPGTSTYPSYFDIGDIYATGRVNAAGYVYSDALDQHPDSSGTNIYVRPAGGELRVTYAGTTGNYQSIRALGVYSEGSDYQGSNNTVYGTAAGYVVLRSDGPNITYLQSDSEVRATQVASGSSYIPVRASSFPTGSMAEYKHNISLWEESALDLINSADIYNYRLISESEKDIDRYHQGLVIGEGYNTPTGVVFGDGVEQYQMNSWSWKAIQELSAQQQDNADDINWLKMENELLKARISKLEGAA